MSQILVYVDKGVDGAGLKQLIRSLKQEIDLTLHSIVRVDAKKLMQEEWEKKTRLLIIPGGRDVFYDEALNGPGTDKISAYVREGGAYLGICAGAYFASSSIEFEKGEPLEVCAPRLLKFFPGVAKGPAYGNNKYSYESAKGAEAAHISWKDEACHIYFNGGCFFDSAEHHPHVEFLSHYLDLATSPPAILQAAIGKGRAILSGVHFEYNALLFPSDDPHLSKVSPFLKKSERVRRKIFREIMTSCGCVLTPDL